MTWWQAGIVGWVAASLVLAVVVARAAAPRARPTPELGAVPAGSDAVATILDVLDTVISESERHPDAVARIVGVEHLLSDGYGLALSLEAEWRRLGREVEELVDLGGDEVEAEVAVRQRRRREVERAGQQLRERLELVWQLTQQRPPGRASRPSVR